MRRLLVLICLSAVCWTCPASLSAKDIFVDNLLGDDRFDGVVDHPVDAESGPVRSLHRAMLLAKYGDRIVLTRAGAVYFDSLSLTGGRHSGSTIRPFTIIGNGATLSGLRTVPTTGWRKVGPDLWKLTFIRKGFYRLARDGKPLPETRVESGINPLESLAAGAWTAWRGDVYFRADGDEPSNQTFSYAAEQTGLSLYDVENVRIVDLTLRDFRFDGVRAQNMCRGVTLENVHCIDNGRAGIAVSGSSHVEILGGKSADNGRHQVLISSPASAILHDVEMKGEPTLVP
jgi:hypothetical protein